VPGTPHTGAGRQAFGRQPSVSEESCADPDALGQTGAIALSAWAA